MRRLLSILLLAAFALPVVAPALALAQDPDAGLPACCRRHGQHHCGMLAANSDPSTHHLTAVCAAWPQRALAPSAVVHPFTPKTPRAALALHTIASPAPHSAAHRRLLRDRSHPERGPPSSSLA